MTAALTLAQRELVRFFRQPNRIVGAIGQPVLFWFLFGAAFKDSLRPPGVEQDYAQFFAPGVAAMIVLFTAIFSTISIIEDRREGFLQSVLVAPVPRSAIVLGKLLGGTLLAMLQALLFLTLVFATGKIPFGWVVVGPTLLILFLMGLALTGLGFCIAWRMDSTQGFHAIMSIFLLPMWLLSGSVFPVVGTNQLGPNPPAATIQTPILLINGQTFGVVGSWYAPGFVSVYRVDFIVPSDFNGPFLNLQMVMGGSGSTQTKLPFQR